ncbi:SDR family NAD(P)-dependent oxidoreductase [Fibrella sp. HMF5335]|uniref:SDR family NAD(P)-dependent oxidoreductase n=1 Tax=Fibrella rubiginis TaxID=2817060 RepID=A0A939GK62_9BACT|nr:SDR family NAD(P)-dependent oxidoreductase [Fibrella rubiginis]MBO0939826.1 SDR family NAD(P)-dependent oxidoreductase [Fibrella rubiginis]
MKLTQNTILVTGGGAGIGLALTERFHAAGNTVLICGRDAAKLQAAANRLPGLRTLVCDVAKPAERQRLFEWAISEAPQLNVLLNNAGIQREVQLGEADEDWETRAVEIAINFEAPIHLVSLFTRHLQQQTNPVIMNVSSGLAFAPIARIPIYSATKAAIHSYTQSLRRQLAHTPVQVIEIIPPAVHTNLGGTDHSFGVAVDEYTDSVMEQLATDSQEIVYQISAKLSQSSRAELDMMFERMNG